MSLLTTSTLNALELCMYIPLPIILVLKPVPLKAEFIPPKILSDVIAVSASKGVGSGLTIPLAPEFIVPLTFTVSTLSITIV